MVGLTEAMAWSVAGLSMQLLVLTIAVFIFNPDSSNLVRSLLTPSVLLGLGFAFAGASKMAKPSKGREGEGPILGSAWGAAFKSDSATVIAFIT